jgi:opacity protein-like surface antigen
MNKIKLLLPVVAGLLLTAQGFAQHGQVSARVNAGVNFLDYSQKVKTGTLTESIDTGFIVGGAVDYKIMPQVRLGISYDYLDNDTANTNRSWSQSVFLANAYYDFSHLIKDITPYVGLGLGYNDLNYNINKTTYSNGGFAWRVAVGANYNITQEVEIGLGYNYTGASVELLNVSNTITNNSILVSLGYNF